MEQAPWGKLDRSHPDPSSAPRLGLVEHSIDVAAVFQALLALPTWRRRFERVAGRSLVDLDVVRLTVLAFLHDVGKAGSGFQSKGCATETAQQWRERQCAHDYYQLGHIQAALPIIAGGDGDLAPLQAAVGVDEILGWGGPGAGAIAAADLWLAAISHHGEPLTLRSAQSAQVRVSGLWPTWNASIDGYHPIDGLRQLGDAARRIWSDAFRAENCSTGLSFPSPFVHAFAGVVSLADWIASNADEAFFPYQLADVDGEPVQGERRWPIARERASQVLRAMRIDVEDARADLLRRRPRFEDLWGSPPRPPRPMQTACADDNLGSLVVLEAETGSGKTEAALWRFKRLFERGEVDALCFLLPTRVAATSIYERLWQFIEALFPDPALRPSVVLAVPGYLRANGIEGRRDPELANHFEVQWPDEAEQASQPRYWAAEHSKRYFAGALVAGTIDQFLLASLSLKHAHLRGALLLRSLVVVDEVHASDAYMTALTEVGLARHVKAGGHALLMSATLTGRARADLLLCTEPPRRRTALAPELAIGEAPYPALSDRTAVRPLPRTGGEKCVQVLSKPWMSDAEAVARAVADALATGARVLVIRNTVRQAQATQRAIEDLLGADHPALLRMSVAGPAALHHGRYAFEDRRLLDAAIELAFGKQAAMNPEARLVVGTQTLEISIDCDADLLITDLAPIDVLLQRLGRLHRHAERNRCRPEPYRRPCVLILTPKGRDLSVLIGRRASGLGIGARSAYENLLAIEAAWRLIEADSSALNGLHSEAGVYWRIPHDNRRLVEAGADIGQLSALATELGGPWPEHFQAQPALAGAQRGQALLYQVDWGKPWSESQWTDLGEQLRTRLGLDSVEFPLAEPWTSPLGGCLSKLSLPAWMLHSGVDERAFRIRSATAEALHFEVGERCFIYDRLGLRPESHQHG